MESTTKNIQEVSLYFLLFTGLIHIISGMMASSGLFSEINSFINSIFDMPFLISALAYFGSTFHILNGETRKSAVYVGAICATITLIGLFINIFLNDKV